jgi:hypothetical protein
MFLASDVRCCPQIRITSKDVIIMPPAHHAITVLSKLSATGQCRTLGAGIL